ncbi:MAG: hypothetical protein HQM11_01265 [SAR324 cluster bacterium]|nr:hypothetical protein [SAR324 cluster bacterium]
MTTPQTAKTFENLLLKVVEAQMNKASEENSETSYLAPDARKNLLSQLKFVLDHEGAQTPLFDQVSLESMVHVFRQADGYQKRLYETVHPCHVLFKNPADWFAQSYRFLYDEVSFLELIRYFGGGKNATEKEIIFRSLVAKLIKTQETIRTIEQNTDFLGKYLKNYPKFGKHYPEYLQESKQSPKLLSAEDSLKHGIHVLIRDISISCLKLLTELKIPLPENAKNAFDKKMYYDALVLTIRTAKDKDMFEKVTQEQYPALVKALGVVIEKSLLHPESYLFQHVKRQYMTDWLVHHLRELDQTSKDVFYQAGKASIYERFYALMLPDDFVKQLSDRANLKNNDIIELEESALEGLFEPEFYDLLLKVYTRYKDDSKLGKGFPMSAQALSSAGDISWEKQTMVAQVAKKVEAGNLTPGQASGFASMLASLKKITVSFTSIAKKKTEAKQSAKATPVEEPVSATPPVNPENAPPPVIFKVSHSGTLLEACFPLPKKDVPNPVKGQKQDISYKDSDTDAAMAPGDQEYFVDLFNLTKESNTPVNKYYIKFSNALLAILRSYNKATRHVQKKMSVAGNVTSYNEDVLYLKITDEIILALGVANMGQSKNLGKVPNGQTVYLRLFVNGDWTQALFRTNAANFMKEFMIGDAAKRFREVQIEHFQNKPEFEALLTHALIKVIESLPQSDFDFLNDESLVGFVGLIQRKAQLLKDKGVSFDKLI